MTDTNGNKVRFMHLKPCLLVVGRTSLFTTQSELGGLTAAYVRDGNALRIAFARCRPKEHFNKRTGRSVAMERLMEGKVLVALSQRGKEYECIHRTALASNALRNNLRPVMRSERKASPLEDRLGSSIVGALA